MRPFRNIIFWLYVVDGCVAGIVIPTLTNSQVMGGTRICSGRET